MAKRKLHRSKRRRFGGGGDPENIENVGSGNEYGSNESYHEDEDYMTQPPPPQQFQQSPPPPQFQPSPPERQYMPPTNQYPSSSTSQPEENNSYLGKIKNGFKTAKNKLYNWMFGIQNQAPPQTGGRRRKRRNKTRKNRHNKSSRK
jgi:hypothetical protein